MSGFQEQMEGIAGKDKSSSTRIAYLGCLGAAVVIFLVLAVLASMQAHFPLDVSITQAIQSIQMSWFELLMQAVSWPGYPPQAVVITIVLVLIIWVSGYRREAKASILVAIGVQLLNWLVKVIVQRPRPGESLVEVFRELGTFSFPSGHVMYYTGFFGFILYLIHNHMKSSWTKSVLTVILVALMALVGLSRIYLGVHWASDVLGGYILGGMWLSMMIWLYRRMKN